MYVERMVVQKFRHLRNIELGPFRSPAEIGELIVLAGPNGCGKSSVLELLSLGLTSRYGWQYHLGRAVSEHSFSIKVGLSQEELDLISQDTVNVDAINLARQERGYWLNVNMPSAYDSKTEALNSDIHMLASQRFKKFNRKLGFFVRADRSYEGIGYNRNELFNYRRKQEPSYLQGISYMGSTVQYTDMYSYIVEQGYHYVYDTGQHFLRLKNGIPSIEPANPLDQYNILLDRLFPGYSFMDVAPEDFTLRVRLPDASILPFQDMSSGEKEIFFLLSFFIRNDVSGSIVVIDEPELHLHPQLARKLISSMRTIRPNNQIWCATHSAELIDEAGRERTFYLRASDDRSHSECIPATQEGAEIQSLRDLFGVSGYVGVARKMVFSEGAMTSADRKTFVNLVPKLAPEIAIIPAGSVSNLYRINNAIIALLESDFARCEFYLIRDRDYLSQAAVEKHQTNASGRLFILSRYHIENYLLDEGAIADILQSIYQRSTSKECVRKQLLEIARQNSGFFLRDLLVARVNEMYQPEDVNVGYFGQNQAVADSAGNVAQEFVDALQTKIVEQTEFVNRSIVERASTQNIDQIFNDCLREVREALQGDGWKMLFPGRTILQRFSSEHKLGDWPALQNLIIDRLAKGDIPVDQELLRIFEKIGA